MDWLLLWKLLHLAAQPAASPAAESNQVMQLQVLPALCWGTASCKTKCCYNDGMRLQAPPALSAFSLLDEMAVAQEAFAPGKACRATK